MTFFMGQANIALMVKILGHRGRRYSRHYDENARAAFDEGLRHADGVEADIAVSKEGTPYIVHDISVQYVPHWFTRSRYTLGESLDRASRKKAAGRRLDEMSDEEIATLRLRKGGRIMRLSELFAISARAPKKTLNLELKTPDAVPGLIKELNHAMSYGRVRKSQLIVSSFDAEALLRMKEADPQIRRALLLLPEKTLTAPIYPWKEDKTSLYRPFTAATLQHSSVAAAAPHYFCITSGMLTEKNVALLDREAKGAKLMVWIPREYLPGRHLLLETALLNPEIGYATHAVITSYPRRLNARLNLQSPPRLPPP
jgi:glycerophosphoryl diester phosphodiesterase